MVKRSAAMPDASRSKKHRSPNMGTHRTERRHARRRHVIIERQDASIAVTAAAEGFWEIKVEAQQFEVAERVGEALT